MRNYFERGDRPGEQKKVDTKRKSNLPAIPSLSATVNSLK